MREAEFYRLLPNGEVQCYLCPHECIIHFGEIGKCGVRQNKKGVLYALTYNKLSAFHTDPIEKNHYIILPVKRHFIHWQHRV
ncbi:MAG: hypothetical protein HC896_06690 [Bacteroidales bacterium]|nr:hypothetical protein [Bacteroidales bacterium]